jgi:cytochrome c
MRNALTCAAMLALTACGAAKDDSAAPEAASSTSSASVAATGTTTLADLAPASFGQCKACHAVEPGKHGIGPSLAGVFGKKAGSAAGFAYSEANRSSGVTWDDPTLDAYLEAPAKTMPGTKMTYAGMKDPAKRKELIEYLKSLK